MPEKSSLEIPPAFKVMQAGPVESCFSLIGCFQNSVMTVPITNMINKQIINLFLFTHVS